MIINLHDERIKRETKKALKDIGIDKDNIIQYSEEDYMEKLLDLLRGSINKLSIIESLFNDFFINTIEEKNSLLFVIFLIEKLEKIIVAVERNRKEPMNEDELKIILEYLHSLRSRVFNAYIMSQCNLL